MKKKINYRTKIESIRFKYLRGELTHEEAKALVLPMIDEMNKIGMAVAKKYNRRFNKLTFGYVFR
jgi:polyhydroxyalkanoate synthesis regulator phasin